MSGREFVLLVLNGTKRLQDDTTLFIRKKRHQNLPFDFTERWASQVRLDL